MSPRRYIERDSNKEGSPYTTTTSNKKSSMASPSFHFDQYQKQMQQKQAMQENTSPQYTSSNYFNMEPAEKKLKYIEHMEYEFDMLMKHKQQLDAKLTRLPYKATNSTMHNLRENVESELDMVEKKLSSVKLELRKLNIIKSH